LRFREQSSSGTGARPHQTSHISKPRAPNGARLRRSPASIIRYSSHAECADAKVSFSAADLPQVGCRAPRVREGGQLRSELGRWRPVRLTTRQPDRLPGHSQTLEIAISACTWVVVCLPRVRQGPCPTSRSPPVLRVSFASQARPGPRLSGRINVGTPLGDLGEVVPGSGARRCLKRATLRSSSFPKDATNF
jgi:hypothetical protein